MRALIIISAAIFFSFLSFCQAQKESDQKPLVAAFVNLQNVPEPFATKLAELKTAYEKGEIQNVRGLSDLLQKYYFKEETPDGSAIPYLIALIDADNSYDTVYGVGYFSLGRMTGVKYSEFHDGAFWRRWWEKNKSQFPEEFRNIKISELPKTEHGKTYQPYPEELETLDGKLKFLREKFDTNEPFHDGDFYGLARDIAEHDDPKAIPYLIAAIEADNSYATVYGLGYFGLRNLTGVKFSMFHDGAFWKRWWEKNKTQFPEEVQKIKIPEFSKTEHGKTHQPFPIETETLAGQLKFLQQESKRVKAKNDSSASWVYQGHYTYQVAQSIGEFNDPTAIPYLIAIIDLDKDRTDNFGHGSKDITYIVGQFALRDLTGVRYDRSHNGPWWKKWWAENKKDYPECVQKIGIPDIDKPWNVPDLTQEIAAWRVEKKAEEEKEALADVAEIPCERLCAPNHEKMEYFLIGPKPDVVSPKDGYKLVVVLPGGDGSADFNPFVRRILKYALKDDYVIAQPIAVKWTEKQQIVWPTENVTVEKQEFSTEQFIEAVVADVSKKTTINPKCVFTLSWSSSGPAAYAAALQEKTAITGSYICMSVFKPDQLPPLERAKDRVFLIEHSPEDRVCPFRMAKEAEEKLNANGAVLNFVEYPGGHGWRGNIFVRIKENFDWIEEMSF